MCVQEDGRLMMEEGEMVNFTTLGKKRKDQAKRKRKNSYSTRYKEEVKMFFL